MRTMKALLAVIAAIGIAKPNAMADTTRIYAGHNATGSAFCAVDFGATTRMYRGHNTTGSASYAIKGDIPKAMIVFLAEKLLD